MKVFGTSVCKPLDSLVNEDSFRVSRQLIAVSDGAGGGGLFAEKWSKYLIDNLPENPILDYNSFCLWLDELWEVFFKKYEQVSQDLGNFALNKFYDEGSCATLACVWIDETSHKYSWISYGDSVIFKYNRLSKSLMYTIDNIANFNEPPFLINCIKPTKEDGFHFGQSSYDADDLIFVATDALSHYLIMMYLISCNRLDEQILYAVNQHTKNSLVIKNALFLRNVDFESILYKLIRSSNNTANFKRHLYSLFNNKLISSDDYSFVCACEI